MNHSARQRAARNVDFYTVVFVILILFGSTKLRLTLALVCSPVFSVCVSFNCLPILGSESRKIFTRYNSFLFILMIASAIIEIIAKLLKRRNGPSLVEHKKTANEVRRFSKLYSLDLIREH